MEFTKDSSTETKKWENIIFRANVLLSWAGCLVVIIAVYGICFTSCTTDRKQKDLELGKRLSALDCNQNINFMNMGEYEYLFDRFHYANGMVDLGGINYFYQSSKRDGSTICNLTGKDTTYYYQVKIYEQQATPPGGTVQCMQIKKVCGQYHRQVVTIGNFEITLMEINGSIATIWVVNDSKKLFAYTEMLPTQGIDPIWQQIKFANQSYQKMDVLLGNRLVLYEYVETKEGTIIKEDCRIPYVASLFGL